MPEASIVICVLIRFRFTGRCVRRTQVQTTKATKYVLIGSKINKSRLKLTVTDLK